MNCPAEIYNPLLSAIQVYWKEGVADIELQDHCSGGQCLSFKLNGCPFANGIDQDVSTKLLVGGIINRLYSESQAQLLFNIDLYGGNNGRFETIVFSVPDKPPDYTQII